jgi:hypothetical protein
VSATELARWRADLATGNPATQAAAAERLGRQDKDLDWTFTVYDKWWQPVGVAGPDLISASGTDPRNQVPAMQMTVKGGSHLVDAMMECEHTLVGVTVETAGIRMPFYIDKHSYKFDKRKGWTGTASCLGIYDILSYLYVWPQWYLPIQAQPISHAIYVGAICTVIESMVSECAIRVQSGLNEFINNALSLNFDFRAWFGRLLQSNANIFDMLKTPVYVVRTNPFLDGSPVVWRTVRMESCATVIKKLTKPYGVTVDVSLWLPGDAQPDQWANLDQPTYVVKVVDRSQIEGPTKTVLDSGIRTVIDLQGSLLGRALDPIINPTGEATGGSAPDNVFAATTLGVHYTPPYAVLVAPDSGERGTLETCEITHHTPKGWQMIIGGKSPHWLNSLINSMFSWLVDSLMILIGISGVPSNILDGFLNDAFFAFQLIENYDRRNDVGPYHPGVEVFKATQSAPYNIDTLFAFIELLYDTQGFVSAKATFRNANPYALGRDIFRGGLVSIVYRNRTRMLTDYVDNVLFAIDERKRDLMIQIGDGRRDEPPIVRHERNLTGLQEAINVATLAPNS